VSADESQKVLVMGADEKAVSASVRRLEIWICALFGMALVALCAIFLIWAPEGGNAMFHLLLACLLGTWLAVFGFIYLVAPSHLRRTEVLLGDDFVAGPDSQVDPVSLFLRHQGHKTALAYRDVRRVNLDVARGRVTGATVVGKDGVRVLVKRVTAPVTVIREIRVQVGPEVTWHKSYLPFAKLTPDAVDALVDGPVRR
jgi:hypothetical protein